MRYSGSLVKSEREKIFRLFSTDTALSFTQIEKRTGLRSNKLAYHLLQMQKEGLLQKNGARTETIYTLTIDGEKYLPILSHVTGKSLGLVPVLLIAGLKNDKVLLIRRELRPYKEYWGLPGGKILHGESIASAASRIMLSKTGAEIAKLTTRSIMLEHVEEKGTIKHSFMLIFATAAITKKGQKERYINPTTSRLPIIPSDQWFIQHKMTSKVSIPTIRLEESPLRIKKFSR